MGVASPSRMWTIWSMARLWKHCFRPVVGQVTSTKRSVSARPRPISCCRLDAPKLPPEPTVAVDVADEALFADTRLDASAHGVSVGLDAFEAEGEPVLAVAGIFKEDILVEVAVIGSAEDDVNVLVAVVVEVGQRRPRGLLDVAEAAGEGRLLKCWPPALCIMRLGSKERRSGLPVPI